MERRRIRIELIDPDERNPSIHTDEGIEARMVSLREYGQVGAITVVRDRVREGRYRLVAGHRTYYGAKRMGWEELECQIADWDPVKAYGWMLIDNQRAEQDIGMVVALLDEQEAEGVDLGMFEVDGDELEVMRSLVDAEDDGIGDGGGGSRKKMVAEKEKQGTVKVVLVMGQVDILEQAIKKTGVKNRGVAMERICQSYLDGDGATESALADDFEMEFE